MPCIFYAKMIKYSCNKCGKKGGIMRNNHMWLLILLAIVVLIVIITTLACSIIWNNYMKEETAKKTELENNMPIVTEQAEDSAITQVAGQAKDSTITQVVDLSIEETPKEEKKYNVGVTGDSPYYVVVNKTVNMVTIYSKDENEEYTVPEKAMICSTGTHTPASKKYPKTTYKTTGSKKRWNYLQGDVYGQYATQITGNILFHSVPYKKKDPASLEYWEYDLLGTTASVGCVRLNVRDAKWIYDNISAGTIVEFSEDEDAGPLEKPQLQPISDNEECRNWDPTDDDESNPWNM